MSDSASSLQPDRPFALSHTQQPSYTPLQERYPSRLSLALWLLIPGPNVKEGGPEFWPVKATMASRKTRLDIRTLCEHLELLLDLLMGIEALFTASAQELLAAKLDDYLPV